MKGRVNRRVIMPMAALFLFSSSALAQKYTPSFPRDGAKTVLENEMVTIWDVTWEKGKPTAMQEHGFDQVTVTLTQGTVKVTRPDKTWVLEQTNPGSVKFEPKGTVAAEEGISDNARRALVVEIKSYTQPKAAPEVVQGLKEAKEKGIPGQFPRPGVVKLFETDHLIIWDDKWPLDGKMGPLHAHYETDIGLFFEAGELSPSIRPVGFANFNAPRIPPHQEMATKGPPRAIFVQFK